jgi:hypothetical protein
LFCLITFKKNEPLVFMKADRLFATDSPILMTAAARRQSACFNALSNLNPIGYWPPKQRVETAAPVDVETILKLPAHLRSIGNGGTTTWAGIDGGQQGGDCGCLSVNG